ncbi:hypothetical protein [Bradyrhizobium sp. S69]|uniref:hypothetical protein n=1 Tax=Bradyrhizobium sp. S69 TaxID=1641856 RepID=UPI00131CE1C5|nr:hypothetical protein [Bradyrhizobium sp. S69]
MIKNTGSVSALQLARGGGITPSSRINYARDISIDMADAAAAGGANVPDVALTVGVGDNSD